MAAHVLIEQHLAELSRRLPGDAVDELADGLAATYEHHLARGLDAEAAVAAAIDEFGRPDEIVAAFVRHSPGRRTAVSLLMTGPAMAACWGTGLILARAWTWHMPPLVAVACGVALLAVIALLLVAATSRASYQRAGVAKIGAAGLLLLDTSVVALVVLAAPALAWLMMVPVTASVARAAFTARALIVWRS